MKSRLLAISQTSLTNSHHQSRDILLSYSSAGKSYPGLQCLLLSFLPPPFAQVWLAGWLSVTFCEGNLRRAGPDARQAGRQEAASREGPSSVRGATTFSTDWPTLTAQNTLHSANFYTRTHRAGQTNIQIRTQRHRNTTPWVGLCAR